MSWSSAPSGFFDDDPPEDPTPIVNIDIAQLAFSLQARLFAQFLMACTGMSILVALDVTEVVLKHQEHYTALDWIIATRRVCQLRLPERAQSRQE